VDIELPDLAEQDGPVAFLLGVIFNQTIRADAAWRAPYALRGRLGHLDLTRLAVMEPEGLSGVIGQRPALHPFATAMARNISGTAGVLLDVYDGRAERVWNDTPGAGELISRFLGFPGIGRHKAEVGLFWLVTFYGVPVGDDGTAVDTALAHCPSLARHAGA
jgi:uncharacterized HhH-GPD family protein